MGKFTYRFQWVPSVFSLYRPHQWGSGYLLSQKEKRPGSPEKPLSGLGEVSYKRYWTLAIMRYLRHVSMPVTLQDIQASTAMTLEDIYNTLCTNNMITVREPTPAPSGTLPLKLSRNRKQRLKRNPAST